MRRLVAAVLLLVGCASPRVISPSLPSLAKQGDAIDWNVAGDEAVTLLSAYLRVDTRNPPGNETEGARFLEKKLAAEGITSMISEFAPGRGSLIAKLKSDAPTQAPLCLLSHLDVVTAEDTQMQGTIRDGFVWGRGALDMKGMGAIETMTMVLLARSKVRLNRDVILIAVADEEVDNAGMHHVVDTHWDELKCGVMINEGGIGLPDLLFDGQTVFPITVAEKGTLWLRMVAKGEAGHGSTPVPGRAPEKLMRAAAKVSAREPPPVIHDSLYELLARAGAQRGGLTGALLGSHGLVDLLVTGKLMAKPPTRAALTNTCQVTGFEGKGSAPNVIPSMTAAIVDCRVRPGVPPETLLAELQTLVGDDVTLEVIQKEPATESTFDDPFFVALERQLTAGRTDVVAGPAISPGFTDSNIARPKGTKAYGLVPFEIDAELLGTMHGKDERVPVKQVKRGLEVLFRAVVDAAGIP